LPQDARGLVWSGVVALVVALVANRVQWTWQTREPWLVYSRAETLPFHGEGEWLGIYHARVRNGGRAEAEDLRCALWVPGASIEGARVSAPLAMVVSRWVEDDTLWIEAPVLNPGEWLDVGVLVTAPEAGSSDVDPLAARAVVTVRAKGTGGVEEPWAGGGVLEAVTSTRAWYVAPLLGIAAGAAAWFARRGRLFDRMFDALWDWRRARWAPDFEDDFQGYPSNWKSQDKMSFTRVDEKGLRLWPIPGADVRYALVLHTQPRFAEGTIQCEVFLEHNAVFNLVVRGDVSDDEFYMARLDSREEFWDCVLAKARGKAWRECNKGQLSHHSPFRDWTTMRVDSHRGRISLYRDDQLVDRIADARLSDGNVAMFAECGEVHVRVIRIWRR
jgi:hypothetical protein